MRKPMKNMIIYHANCWDGFCAAWIAVTALGRDTCELHAAHYGTPPPERLSGRDVYILDFSYPQADLDSVRAAALSLTILDHHKTAEEALRGYPGATFDLTKSGGRLAWEYFRDRHRADSSPPVPVPMFYKPGSESHWLVDYTEDRDLWRHELPDSREVNAALRSYPLSFAEWDRLASTKPEELVPEGLAIRRREQQIIDDHVRNAREIELDGHLVLVVNATTLFSEIAGKLAEGRPFGACWLERKDGTRQWSLRSRDGGVDVSEVAKCWGGGGHANAAGFEATVDLVKIYATVAKDGGDARGEARDV